jgi:hypothetical protein
MISELVLSEQDFQVIEMIKSLADLVKPFGNSKAVAVIDQWLAEFVQTKLLGKNIVLPTPKILRRTFVGVLEVPDEPLLKEMFANLLVSDMNTATKSKVHPKFASILADMTAEEAKFLQAFKETTSLPMLTRRGTWNEAMYGEQLFKGCKYVYHESIYTTGLSYKEIENIILQHRTDGILLPIPTGFGSLGTEPSNPYYEWCNKNNPSSADSYQPIELSPFGKDFCQVVLS